MNLDPMNLDPDDPFAWNVFDRDGMPMSLRDFERRLGDLAYRIVAKTQIGDVEISTVWLGINHNFGRTDDRPIIFETMIFGGVLDQYQDRYATEEEAKEGHIAAVERVEAIDQLAQEINSIEIEGDSAVDDKESE